MARHRDGEQLGQQLQVARGLQAGLSQLSVQSGFLGFMEQQLRPYTSSEQVEILQVPKGLFLLGALSELVWRMSDLSLSV